MDKPTSLTPVLAAPALIILGLLMAAAIAWYHLVLKKARLAAKDLGYCLA